MLVMGLRYLRFLLWFKNTKAEGAVNFRQSDIRVHSRRFAGKSFLRVLCGLL